MYALSIDRKLSEEDFEALLGLCSAEKKVALRRLVQRDDRLRGLWSNLLIRSLACRELGVSNDELRFAEGEQGKPFLVGQEGFHFNSAHSGDWVVALTDDQPVGVDVEEVRPVELAIADSYFSPAEAEALRAQPPSSHLGYFFTLWVLKESYLKATGEGLYRDLGSFTVSLSPEGPTLQVPMGEPQRYLRAYRVAPGYKAGACGAHPRLPREVRYLEPHRILETLRPG